MEYTPRLIIFKKSLENLLKKYKNIGKIYYPIKTNSARELVQIISTNDCGFSVNCPYYLHFLVDECQIAADTILYDNCAATAQELEEVKKKGVKFFVIDSYESYDILKNWKDTSFLIRFASGTKGNEKYGTSSPTLIEHASTHPNFAGISFYIPSSSFSFISFKSMMDSILNLGLKLDYVDIGGGLDGLLDNADYRNLIEEYRKKQLFLELILEPGRNLINPCSKIEATVIQKRTVNDEKWIHLDVGIYSGLIDIYIENKELRIVGNGQKVIPYKVSGSTTDSADFLGTHLLPENQKIGSKVNIQNCGAYVVDMCARYSGAKQIIVKIDERDIMDADMDF